jgi:hypothetical protein
MTAPLTLTTVACARCHTLLYRHDELGWLELHTGHQHDAVTCARRSVLRLATECPWQDIDT